MRSAPWIAVLALIGVASASPSGAHPFAHPKILRLGLLPGRAVVGVLYEVEPGAASRRLRAIFDRDGDGGLDAAERRALTGYLLKTATLFLRLRVDETSVALAIASQDAHGLDGAVASSAGLRLSATLVAPLPSTGEVRLELADRERDGARHIPLTVDVGPGVELVTTTPGGPSRALGGSVGAEQATSPPSRSEGTLAPSGPRPLRDVAVKEGTPFFVLVRIAG